MTFTLGFMQDPEVSDVFKILPRFFLQRMLWEIKLTIQILSKDFFKGVWVSGKLEMHCL